MTVYVGPIRACVPNKNWRWNRSCHMFGDSREELHFVARQIGLRRSWFHEHPRLDHYDLTPGKRREAIAHGAVEASALEVVASFKQPVQGGAR